MSREVVTVPEDALLEETARLMVDSEVGGIPVMRDKTLVGIITESDLFKVLLELLGGRREGLRLSVSTSGERGTLAKITNAIFVFFMLLDQSVLCSQRARDLLNLLIAAFRPCETGKH